MKERIIEAIGFEATKDIWRGNYGSKEFKICDQLNYELFGKHFNRQKRCECIEDFFLLLKSRLKKLNFKSIQMDKKFKLKKGRLVQHHAFPYGVSEFSSDADCLKLLKLNPNNVKHFEEVPEGWESMTLENEKTESKVKAKATTGRPKKTAKKVEPKSAEPVTDETVTDESAGTVVDQTAETVTNEQ